MTQEPHADRALAQSEQNATQGKTGEGTIYETDPEQDDVSERLSQSELRAQLQRTRYRFAGPLPDPAHLREYENTLPGAAERIFAGWEVQYKHRQRLESRSQIFAFGTIILSISAGVICAALGQPWVGGAIAVAAVVGVSATSILRLFPRSG